MSIIRRFYIRERIFSQRGRRAARRAPEEGHGLRSCAGGVRREVLRVRAGGDAVFNGPTDSGVIIRTAGNVGEGVRTGNGGEEAGDFLSGCYENFIIFRNRSESYSKSLPSFSSKMPPPLSGETHTRTHRPRRLPLQGGRAGVLYKMGILPNLHKSLTFFRLYFSCFSGTIFFTEEWSIWI